MNIDLSGKKVVILADGTFPQHSIPLSELHRADFIACCDGAADRLLAYGLGPGLIIGDFDSLKNDYRNRFPGLMVADNDQEINDLTKAVQWCKRHRASSAVILGATGKREDHTLGNISLLSDYGRLMEVKMITDTGILIPVYSDCRIDTFTGQKISIFSLDSDITVSAEGLEYPVDRLMLNSWWRASLNRASGNNVYIHVNNGRLILYLGHDTL